MTTYRSLEIGPTFGHLHSNHQLLLFFAPAMEEKLCHRWEGRLRLPLKDTVKEEEGICKHSTTSQAQKRWEEVPGGTKTI